MAILKYIVFFLCAILFAGCYETFSPDIPEKPVLCVNALLTAGEPMDIRISRTWLYNDTAGNRHHEITDARIYVNVNGHPQDPEYIPKEGDLIHILAESPRYGKAEAEVRVPYAVPIEANYINCELTDSQVVDSLPMKGHLSFIISLGLEIHDREGSEDFFKLGYLWSCPSNPASVSGTTPDERDERYILFSPGTLDLQAEPMFGEHIGVFEAAMGYADSDILFLSDRQFNGKIYTLNLILRQGSYTVNSPTFDPELFDCDIMFSVATISRSYYDYALYAWWHDTSVVEDIANLGFADPTWGYSNVSTGAGVVAACSVASYTLNLKDFLKTSFTK